MKCALITNPKKYEVQQVLQQTLVWAQDKEVHCYIDEQTAESLNVIETGELHFLPRGYRCNRSFGPTYRNWWRRNPYSTLPDSHEDSKNRY
jgi:hypothetical protein